MKRSPIARGSVWRKPRPIVRPGVTPRMPRTWPGLARAIRKRDKVCRRCGHEAPGGPVDHLIPRKLLVGSEIAARANLALLCPGCHAYKTMMLEPRFYRGDIQALAEFLKVVARTGPVPSSSLKGRAYERLAEALANG